MPVASSGQSTPLGRSTARADARDPLPLMDLHAQHESIRPELDRAIAEIIETSAFVGGLNNRYVTRFEEEFAEYLGARHCVTCANGTDAIELALKAVNVAAGAEVIVPALSWISTAEAVSNIGATPVFVDTSRDECNIDPDLIDAACTSATKAIIVVHLHGLPARMDAVLAIARRRGLRVIEDCAQAHGARFDGRMIGTLGDVAAFSFFPSKNLGALGDGGAVVSNEGDIADAVRLIGNHGQKKKNEHLIIGRNSRLDGIQAAILSVKLRKLDEWNAMRRRNAKSMLDALRGVGDLRLPTTDTGRDHAFHLFAIRTAQRDALAKHLGDRKIATAVHYPTPMPQSRAYADSAGVRGPYPNATDQSRQLLSLPLYPELTEEQIERITGSVIDFFAAR